MLLLDFTVAVFHFSDEIFFVDILFDGTSCLF